MPKLGCKPGDIAVIVKGRNIGKFVSVERIYTPPEIYQGHPWVDQDCTGIAGWIVHSLGSPIPVPAMEDGTVFTLSSLVIRDDYLKPIRDTPDNDEALTRLVNQRLTVYDSHFPT